MSSHGINETIPIIHNNIPVTVIFEMEEFNNVC